MKSSRRLAAIMFTDIVGYTAIMGEDEQLAVAMVTRHKDVIQHLVENYEGELIQFYGDGSLSIYPSATFALECACKIQLESQKEIKFPLRIGVHIGELLVKNESVYGSGVNVASRIESLGQAGSILFSEDVYRRIENNKEFKSQHLGHFEFKNVTVPIQVYGLEGQGLTVPSPEEFSNKSKQSTAKYKLKNPDPSAQISPSSEDIKEQIIPDSSIAVLPFVNMSNDPDQEFFCEGISEEIINTIVQLPELKVVGRTSSFRFQGVRDDLRAIGTTLGVSKILEGSVRKSGNNIRITTQLIEASTGFHLWSMKYDRKLDNVFEIQDEISAEIARQLKITFDGREAKPKPRQQTQNIEAYQLYLKGRTKYYQRGTSLFDSLECFQTALEIDKDYALASSGLADNYIMLSFHGYLPPHECWLGALPASRKAMNIGPELAETHNTLGIIALYYERDIARAQKAFEKALEINPANTQARTWYGLFCLTILSQKINEGIKQLEIAIENDPLSSYAHSCYSITLIANNQLDAGIKAAQYAVELDPANMIARYCLGHAYLWGGKPKAAREEILLSLEMSNRHAWSLYMISLIHLELDQRNEALKIYEEMQERYQKNYLPPSCLAITAAALGENDYALELAHEAVDIFDPYICYLSTIYKDSQPLRRVPGFEEVRTRLGYTHNSENLDT